MSQNDKLLKNHGLKVLTDTERKALRGKWQNETYDDMKYSLRNYGKYIMLRPTGFGKTYTCACATNLDICKNKKVLFVYASEILRQTFDKYKHETFSNGQPIIKDKLPNGEDRIIYETYAAVGRHWSNIEYLTNSADNSKFDIREVGLIIFDECQYMGAQTYRKALDFALQVMGHNNKTYSDEDEPLNTAQQICSVPYIGATATVERKDVDVCDKYFTYEINGKYTYCWGEHLYSLRDAIESGLIIPPEYIYIEVEEKGGLLSEDRHTRDSMIKHLKAEVKPLIEKHKAGTANVVEQKELSEKLQSMKELQSCVIKNADRVVHDTMLRLYNCNNKYLVKNNQNSLKSESLREVEELPAATKGSEPKPSNLPEYMRFLVFTPDRDSMNQSRKITGANGEEQVFKGLLDETASYFRSAFGRYGYTIRTTIISSTSNEERNNVNLIDYSEGIGRKEIPEDKLDKVVVNQPMVIDLIFSINMLNVGYHVNDITGLVLRRWTGSNTIYFQQMGRCLSVDSPNIPVVFDFVNDISNKGISMPLYSFDKQKKAETINADGTKDIHYKDIKRKHQRGNCLINGYNPKWNNAIDVKQVIISTESATIEEMHSRLDTYTRRKFSSKLLETAYEAYRKLYSYHRTNEGIYLDNYLDKPKFLYEIYNSTIKTLDKRASVDAKQMSVNYKAFYEYIKDRAVTQDKPCEVFIDFRKLVTYFGNKKLDKLAAVNKDLAAEVKNNNQNIKTRAWLVEINTLLAISKTVNNPNGAIIRLIVNNSEDYRKLIDRAFKMKNDWIAPGLWQINYIYDEVNNFFKTYGITPANIIYYKSEPVEKAE